MTQFKKKIVKKTKTNQIVETEVWNQRVPSKNVAYFRIIFVFIVYIIQKSIVYQ